QRLEGGTVCPPLLPEQAQILARARLEPRQIWRIEKSADAEENGFDFIRLSAQHLARKRLRGGGERALVLLLASAWKSASPVPCNSLSRCNRSVLRCKRNCAAAARILSIFSAANPRSGA